jgi:glycine hydroxymethyltransferase
MGLGNIGDTVLLLPESAGGHFAAKKMLTRLGYNVVEMIADDSNLCIDIPATRKLISEHKPAIIFVDRSEGINYEDFTPLLCGISDCCCVFDASHYLTNIITSDYPSPFDMGFHIVLSSIHKNFPGPQKALVCSKDDSKYWNLVSGAVSDYVSNLHPENIFVAGSIIAREKLLSTYSSLMLENSLVLEDELNLAGLPVVRKNKDKPPSHHIWLKFDNKDLSFEFYKKMELHNILVNYRLLPYNQGYGIRMGTAAATLQGVDSTNVKDLACIIAHIHGGETTSSEVSKRADDFIRNLVPLTEKVNE